jgi:hypothetical protein
MQGANNCRQIIKNVKKPLPGLEKYGRIYVSRWSAPTPQTRRMTLKIKEEISV